MEWIKVTEQLPEKDGFYLVYDKEESEAGHLVGEFCCRETEEGFEIGCWVDDEWGRNFPTHWMPLPEPPY